MSGSPAGPFRMIIVDCEAQDYAALRQSDAGAQIQMTFFGTGRQALRVQPADEPDTWVVNMDLPDMRGTDLLEMLRSRGDPATVLLVGDHYSVDDEIAARCSGATSYFAKPLQVEWLCPVETESA